MDVTQNTSNLLVFLHVSDECDMQFGRKRKEVMISNKYVIVAKKLWCVKTGINGFAMPLCSRWAFATETIVGSRTSTSGP